MNTKEKKILIICAQQRSGTSVLRESLNLTPSITNFGEILNPHKNLKDDKYNLLNYRRKLIRKQPQLALPIQFFRKNLLNNYISYLKDETKTPVLLIDIKYNEWERFGLAANSHTPLLMKQLSKENIFIIHLIRQNKFSQFVSLSLAKKAQKWHLREQDKNAHKFDIKVSIDCKACESFIKESLDTQQKFEHLLSNFDNKATIFYEDMFENGDFSASLVYEIQNLLQQDIFLEKPVLKKINPTISDKINNVPEIINYFVGSPYQNLIHDGLQLS